MAGHGGASGEHLDVSSFVGDGDGKELLDLTEVWVDLAEESGGDDECGFFVLDQERHDLDDRRFDEMVVVDRRRPVDGCRGGPLCSGRLRVEGGGFVGPDVVVEVDPELRGRPAGFDGRAVGGETPVGRWVGVERARPGGVGMSGVLRTDP